MLLTYEGRSKSFEPDYLPLGFWAKNVTGLSNGLLLVFFEKSSRLFVSFARYNVLKVVDLTL